MRPRSESCQAKIVYSSWEEAERAAIALVEDLRDGKLARQKRGTIFAYRCSICDLWHIGHTPHPRHAHVKEYVFSHQALGWRRKPMRVST